MTSPNLSPVTAPERTPLTAEAVQGTLSELARACVLATLVAANPTLLTEPKTPDFSILGAPQCPPLDAEFVAAVLPN